MRAHEAGAAAAFRTRMRIELDQVFVCTDPGAPEAEELVQFSLREGPTAHQRSKDLE